MAEYRIACQNCKGRGWIQLPMRGDDIFMSAITFGLLLPLAIAMNRDHNWEYCRICKGKGYQNCKAAIARALNPAPIEAQDG